MESPSWVWIARAGVGLTCAGLAVWAAIEGRRRWPWLLVALVLGSVYAGWEGYLVRAADPWSRYEKPRPVIKSLGKFDPIFGDPRKQPPPEAPRRKDGG